MYVGHLERSMYRQFLESYHIQRDKHSPHRPTKVYIYFNLITLPSNPLKKYGNHIGLCSVVHKNSLLSRNDNSKYALVMGDGVPCYGALEIVGLLLLLLLLLYVK